MTNKKSLGPGTGDAEAPKVSNEDDQRNLLTPNAAEDPVQHSRYAEVRAVFEPLQEKWPKCFSIYEAKRRPLKIGIFEDILKALDGVVTADELRNALRCYVHNSRYLKNMKEGAQRIDFDGKPVSVIDEFTAEYSERVLKFVKQNEYRKKSRSRLLAVGKPERPE